MFDCLTLHQDFSLLFCEKWSGFFYVHRGVTLLYTGTDGLKSPSERLGNEDKAPCPRALLPRQDLNSCGTSSMKVAVYTLALRPLGHDSSSSFWDLLSHVGVLGHPPHDWLCTHVPPKNALKGCVFQIIMALSTFCQPVLFISTGGVGSLWGDKALEGQAIVCEQWFAPSNALFAQNLPTPLHQLPWQ